MLFLLPFYSIERVISDDCLILNSMSESCLFILKLTLMISSLYLFSMSLEDDIGNSLTVLPETNIITMDH